MHDVEKRATRDQKYHDDDVRLHDNGRYERRKLGERIACEHVDIPPMRPASRFTIADKALSYNQAVEFCG